MVASAACSCRRRAPSSARPPSDCGSRNHAHVATTATRNSACAARLTQRNRLGVRSVPRVLGGGGCGARRQERGRVRARARRGACGLSVVSGSSSGSLRRAGRPAPPRARSRAPARSRGGRPTRRGVRGYCSTAITESAGRSAYRCVARRGDRRRRDAAARVDELPAPEGPRLDRGIDVGGDGERLRAGARPERVGRSRADRQRRGAVPGQRSRAPARVDRIGGDRVVRFRRALDVSESVAVSAPPSARRRTRRGRS